MCSAAHEAAVAAARRSRLLRVSACSNAHNFCKELEYIEQCRIKLIPVPGEFAENEQHLQLRAVQCDKRSVFVANLNPKPSINNQRHSKITNTEFDIPDVSA